LLDAPVNVRMTVDGAAVAAAVRPRYLLSDFLREQAGTGGVHTGCGHGACGACTVAVDGVAVRACLMLAVQADGAAVHSVASLALLEGCAPDSEGFTPLQSAFRGHHALQCGYCTPGLLVSTALFLSEFRARSGPAKPSRAEILDHLNGHLCRCTGYANIIAAIESVSK
jgi:aerobic-type carbon monoxide dehydrogenase small subunit (CoxS/CutS family)